MELDYRDLQIGRGYVYQHSMWTGSESLGWHLILHYYALKLNCKLSDFSVNRTALLVY